MTTTQQDLIDAEVQAEIERPYQEIVEALTRQVAEHKAWNGKIGCTNYELRQQLTAATAHNKLLREAVIQLGVQTTAVERERIVMEALAIKFPDDALKEHDATLVERITQFILYKDYDNDPYILVKMLNKGKYK